MFPLLQSALKSGRRQNLLQFGFWEGAKSESGKDRESEFAAHKVLRLELKSDRIQWTIANPCYIYDMYRLPEAIMVHIACEGSMMWLYFPSLSVIFFSAASIRICRACYPPRYPFPGHVLFLVS
jgi:hypothetical protein